MNTNTFLNTHVICYNLSSDPSVNGPAFSRKALAYIMVFTMVLFCVQNATACFDENQIEQAEGIAQALETTYESAEATAAALESEALALTISVILAPWELPELVSVETLLAAANGPALAAGIAALAAQGVVLYEQANRCCTK